MSLGFLDPMRVVPDHRIPGMVTYPWDEVLLATRVGVVCGADDWDGVEEVRDRGVGLACAVFCPSLAASRRRRLCARGFACWTPELAVLSTQRLDRRIPNKPGLTAEVAAWQDCRNKHHTKADWQFTTADACVKLKRLYPPFP